MLWILCYVSWIKLGIGSWFEMGPNRNAACSDRLAMFFLLQVMQDEVRKAQARGRKEQWLEDLVLLEILGKGGFGTVFRGVWRGTTAAVKVMYARQHERQAMKDALEMAVLTTLSHPHIVQMYSCLTNMVEDAGEVEGGGAGGGDRGNRGWGRRGRHGSICPEIANSCVIWLGPGKVLPYFVVKAVV
jgi:hypothetical protein